MLSVYLQAIEVPSLQEHLQEVFGIGIGHFAHRRQIPAVPPRDEFRCIPGCAQQHFGMVFQDLCGGICCQRSPPQLGLQAAFVDLIRDPAHVGVTSGESLIRIPVTFGNLIAVVHIHPSKP